MAKLKRITTSFTDFKDLLENNCYYVDKTSFIKEIVGSSN